jgi:hypothetical protein
MKATMTMRKKLHQVQSAIFMNCKEIAHMRLGQWLGQGVRGLGTLFQQAVSSFNWIDKWMEEVGKKVTRMLNAEASLTGLSKAIRIKRKMRSPSKD